MAKLAIKTLALKFLFADTRLCKLFFTQTESTDDNGDITVVHGTERPHDRGQGPGYQRDPRSRPRWINERVAHFNPALCRPAEVSDRGNGTYAVLDGGGRAWMSLLAGLTHMECRIHTDLTREDEARLFTLFDSETYKLRSIDTFVALKAAGEPMAIAIAEAARPYQIAASGAGTLKCVGPMMHMYLAYSPDFTTGLDLIKTTCQASAAGWSGATKNTPPTGAQIDAKIFTALGLLVDAAGSGLNKMVLHRVLTSTSPRELEKKINASLGGRKPRDMTTNDWAVLAAKYLAKAYNRSFAANPQAKINGRDIDNCSYLDALNEGGTYSSHVRAELDRQQKLRDNDEVDEAA